MAAELTKEILIKGIKARKEVPLKVADQEVIAKVRPLTDDELGEILDMAQEKGWMDLLNEEVLKKKDIKVLGKAMRLLREVCKRGIVWPDLVISTQDAAGNDLSDEEIDRARDEEIESRLKMLIGLPTLELGVAILEETIAPLSGLIDFPKPQQD